MSTFGAEIEKPVSDITTGQPHGLSQEFFSRVGNQLRNISGQEPYYKHSDLKPEVVLGVQDEKSLGDVSLDNGWNNQETATPVVSTPNVGTGMAEIEYLLTTDLKVVQEAMAVEGATVVNLSAHPLGSTDEKSYRTFVAPKTVYKYLFRRGWNHMSGIDAKAQNSPATGVSVENAADAVTVMIGVGAANIAMFGNSPVLEGKVTGYKESRLLIWEDMMKNSISEGDRKTARFPEKPFRSMAEYFSWMFGPGTNIHFVTQNGGYKSFGDSALLVDGNPSVLEYLQMPEARAVRLNDPSQAVLLKPELSHLAAMQFAQFTGARIRYAFDPERLDIPTFMEHQNNNTLELLNGGEFKYVYIEGRDPGANFPDRELRDKAGDNVAWSALTAPSAIQTGLLNNLEEASRFVNSYDWQLLGRLRNESVRSGLDGHVGDITVFDFTSQVIQIAARGLPAENHHMLAYPEYVLQTHANGADRALSLLVSGASMSDLVISRNVVI